MWSWRITSLGLEVAKYIREDLGDSLIRIILRTGQPGEAPEETVILNYAINAYKTKAELTQKKLFTVMITALRSYCDLVMIETHRQEVEKLYSTLQDSHRQLERAMENVERANRAKSDFLRIMNHELRTPLNVVIGMSDALGEEVYGPLNEAQMRSTGNINQSGYHLLGAHQ